MRIKVLSDYVSPSGAIGAIKTVWGESKELEFVEDDDFTHAIIWNCYDGEDLKIPKENVVGFAHEPLEFLGMSSEREGWITRNVGTYFIGGAQGLRPPFREGYCFQPHLPLSYTDIGLTKIKFMSFFVSDKTLLQGHKYRHTLVNKILDTDLPIDIYGRGLGKLYKDPRVHPNLEHYLDGLAPYTFSIAIENSRQPFYATEKIMNCFICRTIPVYWGANKFIEDNFPSVVHLAGDITEDMTIIKQLYKHHSKYSHYPVNISLSNLETRYNLLTFLINWFDRKIVI